MLFGALQDSGRPAEYPLPRSLNGENRSTSSPDPDAASIPTPIVAITALRFGELTHNIHLATMQRGSAVILAIPQRLADDGLGCASSLIVVTRRVPPIVVTAAVPVRAIITNLKFRPATSVHPDSIPIIAPGFPLVASGFAELPRETNTASRICRTELRLPTH